jgi:thymidylate synthase
MMQYTQQMQDEEQYLSIVEDILDHGIEKGDRTGTGTISTFGQVMRFDISNNTLPLLTTKRIYHRSFIHETLWFLSGSTDIGYLKDHGISIWDSWVNPKTARYDADGELTGGSIGPGAYGSMWRNINDVRIVPVVESELYQQKGFIVRGTLDRGTAPTCVVERKIDQIQNVITQLKENPDSRRIIVHAFDNRMTDFCELPPCHSFFQFNTRELTLQEREDWFRHNNPIHFSKPQPNDPEQFALYMDECKVPRRTLSCLLFARSQDLLVGTPFNVPQYALLTMMIAQVVGMATEDFIWVGGDVHIYKDQLNMVGEQLSRDVIEQVSSVSLNPLVTNIDDFTFEDIDVLGYNEYHPAIKYPVSV